MEQYKKHYGFGGNYEVSNLGNVRSITHLSNGRNGLKTSPGRLLKPHKVKKGYLRVDLSRNGKSHHFFIHRLVAQLFVPNPYGYRMINHKNGVKTDNRAENLEWCTSKQNTQHALKNHLMCEGTRCWMAKLNEAKVKDILKRIAAGQDYISIGKIYGVTNSVICGIKNNRGWKHVTSNLT
jgi:hypothetical protein